LIFSRVAFLQQYLAKWQRRAQFFDARFDQIRFLTHVLDAETRNPGNGLVLQASESPPGLPVC
jgi:hypothetical protein